MLEWSNLYETKIPLVDTQHKKLFAMVNELLVEIESGKQSDSGLEGALAELFDYAAQHFRDEEEIMQSHGLHESHLSLHKMEHHSFVYDIERMHAHWSVDEGVIERFERLLKFITSWLIFHTLHMDQYMSIQVQAIERGLSAEEAYQLAGKSTLNPAIEKMVLNAVLHLWTESAERVLLLERLLEEERAHNERD